jgi:hypothetical protein
MLTDQKGDSSPTPPPADTIGVIAPMAFTSLQALLDNSYETYFGNGEALVTEGTPLWMKELFESGARVIDRLMSDFQAEQDRHHSHLDRQLQDIRATQLDPQSLTSVEGSLRAAITQLEQDTARAVGPTLLALPALTEAATANAKAIKELTEATKANASAIQELGTQLGAVRQELTACAALKPIVDDIRYSQLPKIRDNIKKVETKCTTELSAVSVGVHQLDAKFMEGLDMVNIRMDEMLRANTLPSRGSNRIPPTWVDPDVTPPIQDTNPRPLPSPHKGDDTTYPDAPADSDMAPKDDGYPSSLTTTNNFTRTINSNYNSVVL